MNLLRQIRASWEGLSRITRLSVVAVGTAVVLLIPAYVLPLFANREKAIEVKVEGYDYSGFDYGGQGNDYGNFVYAGYDYGNFDYSANDFGRYDLPIFRFSHTPVFTENWTYDDHIEWPATAWTRPDQVYTNPDYWGYSKKIDENRPSYIPWTSYSTYGYNTIDYGSYDTYDFADFSYNTYGYGGYGYNTNQYGTGTGWAYDDYGDTLGRPIWHRTLLGAGLSFKIVAGALAIALPLSLLLGAIAGLSAGRWPDRLITWIISLIYTVPFFLLVVSLSAIVRPGLAALPWIIGGVIWAAPARVVRSETQRLAASGFLRQERALGHSPFRILFRSLLPMLVAPAAVSLLYLVPEIIGIDAVLTLLGLGANPPDATLGALIYDGLKHWDTSPWLSGAPTLFLVVFAILIHSLADMFGRQLRATGKS